jgi:hypothetical protein
MNPLLGALVSVCLFLGRACTVEVARATPQEIGMDGAKFDQVKTIVQTLLDDQSDHFGRRAIAGR